MRGGAPRREPRRALCCPSTRSPANIDDFLTDLANANKPRNTSAPTAAT